MQMERMPMRIEGPDQTPDFGAPSGPYESVNPANNPEKTDVAQGPGFAEAIPEPYDPTKESQTAPNGPNEPPKPPSSDFENSALATGPSNVQETSVDYDKSSAPQMPIAVDTNVQGTAEYTPVEPQQGEEVMPVDLNAQDGHEYKV